jgi:tetratricopeptide (TPR) repeat protein
MHSHSSQWYTQSGRTDEALAHAELAVNYGRRTGCQSLIANALYSYGASLAPVDANAALAAYEESIAAGPLDSSAHWVASLYQSALLLARAGRHAEALGRLRQSLGSCLDRGELPQLDGGIAYALEILAELGRAEDVLVLVGALRDGALTRLRTMTVPGERRPREVVARARAALDPEVRDAAMARGAAATYTELVNWLLHTLDELIASAA